jgi:carbon-monoxide dehydrogenase large subunit
MGGEALAQTHRYDRGAGYTFPNGAHVAEVEIDPDTGEIAVVAYTAVDDCGRVINPLLASGQVHGGVVQGLGQALLEFARYDDYGQLLTGSFMDYAIPRASQVPDVDVSFHEVLDPNNELGVKGIGEGGACGAPPALVNAVLDALRDRGVMAVDMPLTSEKVWRLLHENEAQRA